MNAKNMFYKENYSFSHAEEKTYAREELIYNATEDLLVILEDMDISKKELSRRLGKSKSFVTQLLSGSRNMTLGTLSDVCFALGFKPEIKLPVQEEVHIIKESSHRWTNQSFAFEALNEHVINSLNVVDRREQKDWVKVA